MNSKTETLLLSLTEHIKNPDVRRRAINAIRTISSYFAWTSSFLSVAITDEELRGQAILQIRYMAVERIMAILRTAMETQTMENNQDD